MIWFGPAGNSKSFYEQGYKNSWEIPGWLKDMGLNAYEYQCGKGVLLKAETAARIGRECVENGIRVSIHAPYYINLSSTDSKKRERSIGYILETLRAADAMGAGRIIVHPGYVSGISREKALELAKVTLAEALARARAEKLDHITICPEVLGRHSQLGNILEVVELCSIDERLIPCIDFGHVHALTGIALSTMKEYMDILIYVGLKLGEERMRSVHIHFSRIEAGKGGEKRHWTLADTQYGPEFPPLAEAILELGIEPVIISESRDVMAEDALAMKRMFEKAVRKRSEKQGKENARAQECHEDDQVVH